MLKRLFGKHTPPKHAGEDKNDELIRLVGRVIQVPSEDIPRIEMLLHLGADPNYMGQPGTTPLTEAARFGNHQAVKILLNYGANPDAVDHWGHTPLETAKACLQQHQNLPAGNFRKQIIPCESIQTCMKMMKETSDRNRESAIAEISFKHTNKVHRLRRQRRKAM